MVRELPLRTYQQSSSPPVHPLSSYTCTCLRQNGTRCYFTLGKIDLVVSWELSNISKASTAAAAILRSVEIGSSNRGKSSRASARSDSFLNFCYKFVRVDSLNTRTRVRGAWRMWRTCRCFARGFPLFRSRPIETRAIVWRQCHATSCSSRHCAASIRTCGAFRCNLIFFERLTRET